ncbi:MAG: outer membrane protein assembly factor, partial [Erythrobacter sp.]|nr:outer membrane protein assembly factor [Erythrobacter sp.]
MASLSSFRKAELRRFFKLALALTAGLGQGTLALTAVPVAAQDAPEDVGTAAEPPGEALPAPEAAPESAPDPAPVPLSLDALIPVDAVDDPEPWAAVGVANPAAASDEAGFAPDTSRPVLDPALTGPASPSDSALMADIDAVFADLTLDAPSPLEPDPELEALASIAAPVLAELPELEEIRINKTVVVAVPVAPDAFPESRRFIQRFRELSNLRQIGDDPESVPQVASSARADEELLGNMLRTYGYYDGVVVRQLSGGRRARENGDADVENVATQPSVRFDILPGTRYQFGRVDLGALPALPEPDASRLMAAFAIKPGDPLYADRIIEREVELRVALGESGYPFANIEEPELLIDHARSEGDLTLDVQPGGKYVFGEIVSSEPRFLSGRHLGRIARFDPGDGFQQSLETDLRRAVIATGLVSSVTVTPRETRAPEGDQPGEVALDVGFERAPLRTIAGAIGYGTEDGFKVEGRWEHRNLFPPEGALRLRTILGTREALASVGVRRNNFLGRDQVLSVDVFASDITTQAVDSRGFGTRATFEKVSNLLFQKPLSWQIGGELLYTDERNRTVKIAPGGPLPRRSFLI